MQFLLECLKYSETHAGLSRPRRVRLKGSYTSLDQHVLYYLCVVGFVVRICGHAFSVIDTRSKSFQLLPFSNTSQSCHTLILQVWETQCNLSILFEFYIIVFTLSGGLHQRRLPFWANDLGSHPGHSSGIATWWDQNGNTFRKFWASSATPPYSPNSKSDALFNQVYEISAFSSTQQRSSLFTIPRLYSC